MGADGTGCVSEVTSRHVVSKVIWPHADDARKAHERDEEHAATNSTTDLGDVACEAATHQTSTAFAKASGAPERPPWRSNTVAIWAGIAAIALGQIMIAVGLGRYAVTGIGTTVWRIDKVTGQVSYCVAQGIEKAPFCGPWGALAWPVTPPNDSTSDAAHNLPRLAKRSASSRGQIKFKRKAILTHVTQREIAEAKISSGMRHRLFCSKENSNERLL